MALDDGENPREFAIVADELALVRAGIAAVLEARGIEVGAHTRSGRELVSLATVDRPDLVVVGAPADLDIADVVRRLVRLRPHPRIVVLLPPAQDHVVRYLLGLGAVGIALRSVDADELGVVVDAARKGDRYVVSALHGALSGAVALPALDDRTVAVLTGREREVLVLLTEGRTNREIASELSLSLATVKSHLVRLYSKLEVGNRNEALGKAVALGLIR
ncbi:MAG TPA: response regulator transcription factor [Acidimicrobiia bacterium]|nr:response regulator transcription factor [Acidimicrobiia bacterium]